jgi:hypothetical protein
MKHLYPRLLAALCRRGPALTKLAALALLGLSALGAQAQRTVPLLFQDDAAARSAATQSPLRLALRQSRPLTLNRAALQGALATAPLEGQAGAAPLLLALPLPDGGTGQFRVVEAPIMAPGLAAQFPGIKTYRGVGVSDPAATLRLDCTPQGFHAQVLSPTTGSFYIDPATPSSLTQLLSFWRRDMPADAYACDATMSRAIAPKLAAAKLPASTGQRTSGPTLRTYRLAVAATGEYTAAKGGTVAAAQAAIVSTINRVVGVYEKELAVRFVLVTNNANVVYTNAATDPYDNTNTTRILLTQNQTNLDAVIGTGNYDIGHVFGTTTGGTTNRGGTVCSATNKAQGTSGIGSSNRTGDAFDVTYVAHELGHQLGANHTFNSVSGLCSGRFAASAYEPGSGSTIMSYAGICAAADNVQATPDAYFHVASYDEIQAFLALSAATCGVGTSSGSPNTNPPTVAMLPASGKVLPIGTPFRLTAGGYDLDNPSATTNVTYCWEEYDLGSAAALTATQTAGDAVPLFRSFPPTASPTRYFPSLRDVIANTTSPAERLPTVARPLNFRVTLRDMFTPANTGMGAVGGVNSSATVSLSTVSTAGPFVVTAPNAALTWTGTTSQTVTWNVAGTTANGVNCATVNIRLSTDGGLTYPTLLLAGTPNDGSQAVVVPSVATTTARIMVEATDNYFYDISNTNFTINAAPVCPTPTSVAVSSITRTTATVSFAGGSPATGYVVTTSPATTTRTVTASPVSLTGLAAGTAYTVYVQSNCAAGAVSGAAAATFTTLAPAVCSPPTSLVVSSITATSATVSFAASPSSPTGYSYTLTTASSPPTAPVPQPVTGTAVSLTGLASSTSYTLTVQSNCADGGFGVATTTFRTSIANDECIGAITLFPGTTCNATAGTVAGATQSQAPSGCNGFGSPNANDVWYSFVALGTAHTVRLTAAFNGVLEVLTGTCGSLSARNCTNTTGFGGSETLALTGLTPNTRYFIRVYPFNGLPSASTSGFSICVTGPSTIWNGSVSSDWFAAANWNAGVPTTELSAIIPAVSSTRAYPLISAGTASTLNLTLNTGATLNQTGGTLNVRGNLTNSGTFKPTGGTVVVGAPAGGVASNKVAVVIGNSSAIDGDSTTTFWNLLVESTGASLGAAGASVQQTLTLTGDLLTQENPFTLLSRVVNGQPEDGLVVNQSGVVNGTATVQRAIDPRLNAGLGYRHYSAPVSSTTVADLATTGFTPVLNLAYNTSATPNAEIPFPTVFGYDDSRLSQPNSLSSFDKGYYSPADPTDALAVGRGYTVNLPATEQVDFQGTLNNGDQTLALTSTRATYPAGGWQLLGNPYPAPLNYALVDPADRAGLEAAIYVYSSTSQYAGRYRSYVNGIGNAIIPMGQGFFARVVASQPTATMTFRNSQRLTAPTSTTFQRTAAETRPLVQLTLQAPGSPLLDEATVYFENGATIGFEPAFDAEKLANPTGLNLATSLAGGRQLSIDGQPELAATQRVVPLAVGVPVAGTYTFTASQLLNLSTVPVYLRDAQLGTLTDLRQQSAYQFTVSSAAALNTTRFALVFSPQQALATVPAALVQQVAVYPNPAKAQVAIDLPPSLSRQPVTVSLLDALGRVVRQQVLPAGSASHTLSLATMAPGVYSLRLSTELGTLVKKLVVE